MAVGRNYACVLAMNGDVSCWQDVEAPWLERNIVKRHQPPGTFSAISVGTAEWGDYACGIASDGTLHCWGKDWDEMFIDEGPLPAGSFAAVSTGASGDDGIVCGVRTDGSLGCWGLGVIPPDAGAGYFGLDAAPDGGLPASVYDDNVPNSIPGPFTAVSVGNDHAADPWKAWVCAIEVGGSVQCWPNGSSSAAAPSGAFKAIDTKNDCGIRTDGTVTCWGPWFKCGTGDTGCTPIPDGTFEAVGTNSQTGCGIRTDGTLACWGYTSLMSPPMSGGGFTSLGVGFARACAIDGEGHVVCWGRVVSMP